MDRFTEIVDVIAGRAGGRPAPERRRDDRIAGRKSTRRRPSLAVAAVWLAGLLIAAGPGCHVFYDLDAVALRRSDGLDGGADTDVIDDATDVRPDQEEGIDGSGPPDVHEADSADASADDAGDTSPGDTDHSPDADDPECAADLGANQGGCDLDDSNTCKSFEYCTLFRNADAFFTGCDLRANAGRLDRGDSCAGAQGGDCGTGLFCAAWGSADPRGITCSTLCTLADGTECGPDEFCTNPYGDDLEAFGFCTSTCDPYDTDACPDGQVCTPDFNYPDETCSPHFRCLKSNDPSHGSAEAGQPCSRRELDRAGCPEGMVCAPSADGDVCRRLCRTDQGCGNDGGGCNGPSRPWDIRYCQL